MTSNDTGEDNASVIFGTNGIFVSSTSYRSTPTTPRNNNNINNNNINNYEPLAGDMLDAELDSDPQMSDSEISWQSVTDVDSLTATNHWRGWKHQTISSLNIKTISHPPSAINSIPSYFSSLEQSNEGLLKILF